MKAYKRLRDGLDKLEKASKDVDEMSKKLEVEKLQLKTAQQEVDVKMQDIAVKKKEAEKISAEVQKVVDECAEQARQVGIKNDAAEIEKAKAEPKKIEAENAVKSLDPKIIPELSALPNPPQIIQRMFDIMMIFLNEKVEKIAFDESFTRIDNATKPSWSLSVPVMTKPTFF